MVSGTESSPSISSEPIPELGVPGLISVLVLCCGQLEYTRLCVPSVLKFARLPFEVIAVDSGALDGTAEYWAGIQAAATSRVEIVCSSVETDLVSALQAGLSYARGESVVLLDNDTIVPSGWLAQMAALLNTDSAVGMVGSMTNYGPAHQVVWPVPYKLGMKTGDILGAEYIGAQVEIVNRFAQEWRESHRGQWSGTDRLGGGCVMIRRSVLRLVGAIPRAPLRFFDPEALSRRVVEVGFRLACCRDLFVHSFGSRAAERIETGVSAHPNRVEQ
ncbi:Putative glycosyltransferase OS=Singulisphaera acidiphila (strain ATCC BAA-1392 / DSM 18658 / VKM B-2454 / MOB10) GN=Sinac_0355 PE=4 SV=1: Glycos_transf_2 [Gemmata massiliana]|uniref:Glycosyltransferase 2-like domain-containing protein n=1 Tax=Gemmata massiliana TaxID=1210884 RepID=A0A6P2CX28_9BACT|nr:Putative glycosyltransferase OS=Singulisphaera acidiphila (strain ATCC BAA-1392 / DSM 18658 / VKM B-2454 / MOB10) GN=Sinac_0355 PE=4 SV=1: Glycos_transf_2 [Gemmata massiliana]